MVPSILIVEDDLTFSTMQNMAGEKRVRSGDCKYAGQGT